MQALDPGRGGVRVWRWQRLKEFGSQHILEVSRFPLEYLGEYQCVCVQSARVDDGSVMVCWGRLCSEAGCLQVISGWCAAGCLDLPMESGVSDLCLCVGEDVCTSTPEISLFIPAWLCIQEAPGPADLKS